MTPNTPAFDEKWRTLANSDPDFGRDQTRFIKETHYDIQAQRLKNAGIDLIGRGPAVQEALFSTSVQYRGLTKGIFERGLKAGYGDDYNLSQLSDKDIVVAIQDYKIAHNDVYFRSSSPKVREFILDRAANEKNELIALSEGNALPDQGRGHTRHLPAAESDDTLRAGSRGIPVTELQNKLTRLGYLLEPDGSFGPVTKAAVASLQRDHQLMPDGVVGPMTRRTLDDQVQGRDAPHPCRPPARLDDPTHPDHFLFQQARNHVYRLDQQLGRAPDQMSDNLASALTVSAKASGLERIDRITLGDNRNRLWATQMLPGQFGAILAPCANVSTSEVNTSMEQSGARWPSAMQQFQLHQEQMRSRQQVPPRTAQPNELVAPAATP